MIKTRRCWCMVHGVPGRPAWLQQLLRTRLACCTCHIRVTALAVRLEHAMMKLAKLPIVAPKADPGDRLRAIFTIYKKARKRRPIVIIDINEKMEPATLSKLLMAAKQLGFEEKLATFIFVVSASRSALGLTVTVVKRPPLACIRMIDVCWQHVARLEVARAELESCAVFVNSHLKLNGSSAQLHLCLWSP
ncbi:hypothetical protein JKP88DRAFT_237309, partial [Tribonema minus]